MGVLDNGGQKISFDYRNIGTSKDFNKLNYLIQNRGIYEEGTLTKITDVAVKINAGLIAIANDISNEVSCRIETTELSNEIVVSPTNCFVIMSFVWIDTPENYAEFSAVPYSAITANDIIIGKCIYESVTLVSFDYGKQTKPNVTNETYGLNVICNEPSDDKVYIQPGQAVINGKLVTISSAIAVDVPEHTSGAVSRTDIIVLDDAGAGDIITNRTSVDPPLYPNSNNIVLAEITRTADGDIVIDNHITNVLNIPIQNVMDPLVINTLVTDDATIENAEINSLKRKIVFEKNPNTWSQIGSGLSISSGGYPVITSLSSTDIAFIDDYTSAELRTYRWNGSAWSQIGSSLSISSVGYPVITSLSSTDIAFIDNTSTELRTYRWNGSAWSQIGSGLSISSGGYPVITSLSSTDIAFIDNTSTELRTYRWSGSAWSQIGSGLSISAVGYSSITSLSSTDIAFIDYTSAELRTYRWSGSAWSQIGSSLSISSGGYSSITSLSSTDIAFIDNSIKELRTYRWSGSAWSQIGSGLSISSVGNSSITSLSSTDTAFIDHTIAELRTYRLSFTEFPPNPAFGTL